MLVNICQILRAEGCWSVTNPGFSQECEELNQPEGRGLFFEQSLKKKNTLNFFFSFIVFVITRKQSPGKLSSRGVEPLKPLDFSHTQFAGSLIEKSSSTRLSCIRRGSDSYLDYMLVKKTPLQLNSRQMKPACQYWTIGHNFIVFWFYRANRCSGEGFSSVNVSANKHDTHKYAVPLLKQNLKVRLRGFVWSPGRCPALPAFPAMRSWCRHHLAPP